MWHKSIQLRYTLIALNCDLLADWVNLQYGRDTRVCKILPVSFYKIGSKLPFNIKTFFCNTRCTEKWQNTGADPNLPSWTNGKGGIGLIATDGNHFPHQCHFHHRRCAPPTHVQPWSWFTRLDFLPVLTDTTLFDRNIHQQMWVFKFNLTLN